MAAQGTVGRTLWLVPLRLSLAPHIRQGGRMSNPLSRREVLKFGAYTTVGGVLTPGISLAQAIVTETKGITARDIQLNVAGTMIPGYDARPEAQGQYPIIVVISGFTGNSEHNKDVVRRFAHAGFYAIASSRLSFLQQIEELFENAGGRTPDHVGGGDR